ncbi:MAG: hypothetical protein M3015_13255 [Bacteroidota bacterium]|nr:hypothetical protein [Bacteroidota bacterium]
MNLIMALHKDKKKFKSSPHPMGGKPTGEYPHFVVQKHHPSHIHYNLRLVLLACPKVWLFPKAHL